MINDSKTSALPHSLSRHLTGSSAATPWRYKRCGKKTKRISGNFPDFSLVEILTISLMIPPLWLLAGNTPRERSWYPGHGGEDRNYANTFSFAPRCLIPSILVFDAGGFHYEMEACGMTYNELILRIVMCFLSGGLELLEDEYASVQCVP
ncbi:hypothetical protein RRG08_049816 [Elysia crispata]|uniref:Uncharacterized protein n=1 Tax=Elysia crispata TaxID=231223 RepID=A0AAE0XPI5_9GAST|nr:hypothetical protein RRG08_049816 [Elysia crispata]